MKILIIIDTALDKKYMRLAESYRKSISKLFKSRVTAGADCGEDCHDDCYVFDMNDKTKQVHEKFYAIQGYAPDFLITFDMAGFECRNGSGNISLNSVPCRQAHILTKKPSTGAISADEIFNYSLYFIAGNENTADALKKNDSIAHIECMSDIANEGNVDNVFSKLWSITEMDIDYPEYKTAEVK